MAHDAEILRKAAARLRRNDPVLAVIIRDVGPCRLRVEVRGGAFAALAESIVYQQITGKAAASIYGRLRRLVRRRHPRPQDILAATAKALRKVGLSRQKVAYLRDLSERVRDGLKLRSIARLEDEAVIEALIEVKGIGRWTAEMFLMFRLHRPDVLPAGDLGIVNAIRRLYGLRKRPDAKRVLRIGEAWKPYRSVASWYLWQTLRNEPDPTVRKAAATSAPSARAAGSPRRSLPKSRVR